MDARDDFQVIQPRPCVRAARPDELDAVEEMYGQVIDAMIGTPQDILWRRGEHPSREMLENECAAGNLFVGSNWGCVRFVPPLLRGAEAPHAFEETEAPAPTDCIVGAFVLNGDQTVGYEKVSWTVELPASQVCVIHALAVAPSARGLGMSRVLLDAAVREARLRGARSLRLDVVPYNESGIGCYRAFGMHDLGIHELAYDGFEPLPFRMFELAL